MGCSGAPCTRSPPPSTTPECARASSTVFCLVGGSTRIPRIAQLLAERLGHEPHGEIDPDLCVAFGAAVQAGIEMGEDMQSVLVDITPYTFGTSAVGELHGLPYAHQFIPLIRRNTRLPASRTEAFFTMSEEQEAVEIKVYQGEDPDALQNVEIGSFHFSGLNREREAYDQGILFTYHLDLDGLLKVHAVERATGREIHGVVENAMGRFTEEDLAASRERIEGLWGGEEAAASGSAGEAPVLIGGSLDASGETRETLERAVRALDTAPAEDQEEMVDLIEGSAQGVEGGANGGRRDCEAEPRRDSLLPGVALVQCCPTCGAGPVQGPMCRRCRTDLRKVLAIERAAAGYRRRALAALERGCGGEARAFARRACTLHRCVDSLAVRAVVALAEREFPLALRLWREARQDHGS